jgi:hypothetical protein
MKPCSSRGHASRRRGRPPAQYRGGEARREPDLTRILDRVADACGRGELPVPTGHLILAWWIHPWLTPRDFVELGVSTSVLRDAIRFLQTMPAPLHDLLHQAIPAAHEPVRLHPAL